MDRIDWAFRVLQAVNVLILAAWLLLVLFALMSLRRCQLDEIARGLWVIVVLLVPLVGPLAFLVVRPGHRRRDENEGA